MKKFLAILLTVALLVMLMPTIALAAPTAVNTQAELVAALAVGGEIELGADIDAGEIDGGSFFAVSGGTTVSLDLNGHILQGKRVAGAATGTGKNTGIIGNAGTLTIKDTAGGGRIEMYSDLQDFWNSCTAAIINTGTLTVESGTLINNGGTDMAYGVDTWSNGHTIVNGGVVKSINYIGIRAYASNEAVSTDITVNGGEVYGASRGVWLQHGSSRATTINLTITGGNVESPWTAINASCFSPAHPDGGDSNNITNISISGGVFINESDVKGTLTFDEWWDDPSTLTPTVSITGGTFQNNGSGGNICVLPQLELILSNFAVSGGTFSAPVNEKYLTSDASITIASYKDTEVTAGIDPTFMIVIPAAVDFGSILKDTGVKTKEFPVSAVGVVLEPDCYIDVTVTSPFMMNDETGTADLPFTLSNEAGAITTGSSFTTFTGDDTEDGEISVDTAVITTAGSYQGTLVFDITYQN